MLVGRCRAPRVWWAAAAFVSTGACLLLTPAGAGAVEPVLVSKWGGTGSGDGQFNRPADVTVAPDGSVYVADTNNHRIQKFSANGSFITKWGVRGSGDGQLEAPGGVAVDGQGNVYVADTGNHRVQMFTAEGGFIAKWGGLGVADGRFAAPYGIATDSSGFVYVTELAGNRVQKFTSAGGFVAKWGGSGSGDGQFRGPAGIEIDERGAVFVVDRGNNRIQMFNLSGVRTWGGRGNGPGRFNSPLDIASVDDGVVHVSDPGNRRIQTFGRTGAFRSLFGRVGGASFQPTGLGSGAGDLYVVDAQITGGDRVLRLRPGPVLGRSVIVSRTRGRVLVSVRRGGKGARIRNVRGRRFVRLRGPRRIPIGAFLDARRGTVKVVSARDAQGRSQTGWFSKGVFKVGQSRRPSARGLTTMRLSGGDFSDCRASARSIQAQASRKKKRRRVKRRGRGRSTKGARFGQRGKNSSNSSFGTVWVTADTCDETVVAVEEGKVRVRDFTENRTATVRAGEAYEACGSSAAGVRARDVRRRRVRRRVLRRLRGIARGRFRTRACHASGVVRGG